MSTDMMNKILLHCCCGPCSIAVLDKLKSEGIEPLAYFYNPNIHPYKEFTSRRDCWEDLMQDTKTEFILNDTYPLEDWLRTVAAAPQDRCHNCYRQRMWQAAKMTKKQGLNSFSTTLLISPYQNHELLIKAAEEAAAEFEVRFHYEDFRPLFRKGQQMAREKELYLQKYCGCIYSEKERYCPN